jgi:pimeloyl-ACP methyl ester carboxylesterase
MMQYTQQAFYIGAMQALRDGFVGGTYTVKDVHFAILNLLKSLGISGLANRIITEQVYRIIINTGKIAGWGVEQALKSINLPEGTAPISRNQLLMVSSLNGAFGDHFAEQGRLWALPMSLCKNHIPILSLEQPQPVPTFFEQPDIQFSSHVVIFIHGVCLNDQTWNLPEKPGYGNQWEANHQITTFYLRYNSGLAIHKNGRNLASLLEQFIDSYPTDISRLTLIGHSMGGLVARSACRYGQDYQYKWVNKLTELATLGSPHQGAPLERIGQWITDLLSQSPVTQALSHAAQKRSEGIKDLRYASLRHEDWENAHPDEHKMDPIPVPLIPSVRYMFLAADWKTPAGERIGDGLVPISSAHGNQLIDTMDRVDISLYRPLLKGINHMDLLQHEDVFHELDNWLFNR